MSNERKQVLELLSTGKISPGEAEQLLDKLGAQADSSVPAGTPRNGAKMPQCMCVDIMTHQGDAVNVRLPFSLLRNGIKLSALMPKEASEAMSRNGVDLSQLTGLSGEALVDALRDMHVDICSHEGDVVKVYCQ
jgi:hypothetical protein